MALASAFRKDARSFRLQAEELEDKECNRSV